jgi:acyl-CoA thioesterase
MDEKVRSAILKRVQEEGYAEKLHMELVEVADGHAVVEMVPGPTDTNIFETVHGGAIFSLIDEAFQLSCNSHGTVAVALSVNVVYHNPAEQGRRLRAESTEVHLSKKTATYDIRVTDEKGVLIATSQALAYRKKQGLPFMG